MAVPGRGQTEPGLLMISTEHLFRESGKTDAELSGEGEMWQVVACLRSQVNLLGGKLLPASTGAPCSLPTLSKLPRTCLFLPMLVAIEVHTGFGGHKETTPGLHLSF